MGTKLSSPGGRMGRARNRQVDQEPPKFTGAFKNQKTRGKITPIRLTMTAGKSAARRARGF